MHPKKDERSFIFWRTDNVFQNEQFFNIYFWLQVYFHFFFTGVCGSIFGTESLNDSGLMRFTCGSSFPWNSQSYSAVNAGVPLVFVLGPLQPWVYKYVSGWFWLYIFSFDLMDEQLWSVHNHKADKIIASHVPFHA